MCNSSISPFSGRFVSELKEVFIIPNYQRGYRWERSQVKKLLDDIYSNEKDTPYYLQPIVVSRNDDGKYYLVDGQQRLTTIYLILQRLTAIKRDLGDTQYNFLEGTSTEPKYSLIYQNRSDSENFLKNISDKTMEDARIAPDYLYMWHAYQEIVKWTENHRLDILKLVEALNKNVKIIWYELPPNINNESKFADLNIGKIPLTNSELVKALFMHNTNGTNDEENQIVNQEKAIIINQWDGIERELRDSMFWGFLTTESKDKYDTLIDLVFNIIAKKNKKEKDDFFTFIYFENDLVKSNGKKGKEYWDDLYLKYQRLRDWYDDRHLYHSIGYLVTQDKSNNILVNLFAESKDKTHSELKLIINKKICERIDITKVKDVTRLNELKYGPNTTLIESILTLFNVLSTDKLSDDTERYPFYLHNQRGWSLEHIHAQNSEGLNTVEKWKARITDLKESLKRYEEYKKINDTDKQVFEEISTLISDMDDYIQQSNATRNEFEELSNRYYKVTDYLAEQTSENYLDLMANMALLGKDDNSMLNNSVFDVKRKKIINKMLDGYIPICTQRVFLKAFPSADDKQFFYWSDTDREAYIDFIEETLKEYLPQGYVTEKDLRNQKNKEQ